MKKSTLTLLAAAFMTTPAATAHVNVEFPSDFQRGSVRVSHQTVDNIIMAKTAPEHSVVTVQEIPVTALTGYIILTEDSPARYSIDLGDGDHAVFYASPDDNLHVEIMSISPLLYTVTGSELTEGWSEFESDARPCLLSVRVLEQSPNPCPEQLAEYYFELNSLVERYILTHPGSSSAVAALMSLRGQDFLDAFSDLTPESYSSILFPLAKHEYLIQLTENQRLEPEGEPILAEEIFL